MRSRASRLRVWLLSCLLAGPAQAADPALTELSIRVREKPCSALLLRPADARALLVLAHGHVMNVHHPFMESISSALAHHGIATLRFNFPYAEAKREGPDGQPLLIEAITAATREGERLRGPLPLLVGGKSLGGLVAAEALGRGAFPSVRGLVIFSYPLHAPGRPSAANARRLETVKQPILILQGTEDPLADLTLMEALVAKLGPRVRLQLVQDAGHGFELPEGSRKTQVEVYDELASGIASFVATLEPQSGG